MNLWPYLIPLVLIVAMVLFAQRARRRQLVEQSDRSQRIHVGTEVMTTSGLYGTVVSRNDDDETVQLSIAPGVEVKWAVAALRDADSLSDTYRGPLEPSAETMTDEADQGPATGGYAVPQSLRKHPRTDGGPATAS